MAWCRQATSHYLSEPVLTPISVDIQHHSRGGVLPIWWVIHMCRGFDPLFWASGYQTRSFWGVFSHPPTQKQYFGYKSSQNSIFLAPKYHFPLDLFWVQFSVAHGTPPAIFGPSTPPPPPRASLSHNELRSFHPLARTKVYTPTPEFDPADFNRLAHTHTPKKKKKKKKII